MKLALALLMAPFGGFAILWSVPGTIMSALVSLGDPQRIVFIDKQLSKDVDKLHADWSCMLSANIGMRLFGYWITYPFIRHRATTKSVGFRCFMWINALGMWCWIVFLFLWVLSILLGLDYSVR